ncbi:unknown [Pasteurella multocida subsp. multocida str. Pm70]|uniref:Uncharacterized protein PM1123 n=1 Tax=Pasteurella multocida (strain Pm70) TaxID=272843 RepID=Y1123_PASMU|nr:RecName: Full=Uncharacterized protein PM1123 [Pasteurella multocida subsp. multocida str. Pm70]AAK03207.1 unknown [Pasteurella multocida subsp. multocida str. Pm70]
MLLASKAVFKYKIFPTGTITTFNLRPLLVSDINQNDGGMVLCSSAVSSINLPSILLIHSYISFMLTLCFFLSLSTILSEMINFISISGTYKFFINIIICYKHKSSAYCVYTIVYTIKKKSTLS